MFKNVFVSLTFVLLLGLGLVFQSGCGQSAASSKNPSASATDQTHTGSCCGLKVLDPAAVENTSCCPKDAGKCVCSEGKCECCDACKNGGECKCDDCKCATCCPKKETECKCDPAECQCCEACKTGGECKCDDCKCCDACPKK